MNKQLTEVSKYLSYLLRHQPEAIGLKLDEKGWAKVADLIDKSTKYELNRELIDIVVATNDKQRFAMSDDGMCIRANQGHSLSIELDLAASEPPQILVHGTAEKCYTSIRKQGLLKGQRHHVHLTESLAVAKSVGGRYGKPVLLSIESNRMFADGFEFYKTANNVWLVDKVPPEYLSEID